MASEFSEMGRRTFVKASAGAVLAAAASPVWAWARGDDKIKVGVIGCGGRGTGAVMQALLADKGVILWAAGDMFGDRITACLKNVDGELKRMVSEKQAEADVPGRVQVDPSRQFTGFDAYTKVIAECDVVICTSPPHFRHREMRAAIEAGKHVFAEKPVAVDAAGIRSVLETAKLAKEKNLCLMSGFCWRHSAKERDIYTRVHEGAVGDVKAVWTNYNSTGWIEPKPRKPEWSDVEFQLRNWQYFTWCSGDHIVEQAVHRINTIMWALKDQTPTKCVAVGGRQCRPNIPETGNVYDHFSVTYEFESGVRAFHMCRHWPASDSDNSDVIMGTKGIATVNGFAGVHRIDAGGATYKSAATGPDMYQQEHNELFAAIRSGKPFNDMEVAAHATMMAIMGRMAAYTGKVISWEEAMKSQWELKPRAYAFAENPVEPVAKPGTTQFR